MQHIGIVGAGNMGSGIAQKYATENCFATLVDLSQTSITNGQQKIEQTLQEAVKRRLFTEEKVDQILKHIKFSTNLSDLADADLIIEAIYEDKTAKQNLFKQLDSICSTKTIFATNTSSLYVEELANATKRPDRFLGLHYFFHPAKNKLVEVIKGKKTSDETFISAWKLQEKIGKIAVESKDAPGFIVNRFFVPWLNEAMRLVNEKKANIATVEAAAKKTFGIAMGPFELMNITGVPIALHAATTLANELGDFYAPCSLINSIVEQKKEWDLSGEINESSIDEVGARLLAAVFYVATQMVLGEKVCSINDCDLGARVGLRWKKGPFELMSSFAPDLVTAEIIDTIGYLTFNRPESLNALNEAVIKQLDEKFSLMEQDSNIKGIILQGRGKAFVAGADTNFFVEQIKTKNINRIEKFTQSGQNLFLRIDNCAKPVICIIDGLALGGGLELALCCDYIIATQKARMGFPETGIGIYPGLGGTQRTPRKIGIQLARWLILSGEIINADTAHAIGLVDKVAHPAEVQIIALNLINSTGSRKRNPSNLSFDLNEKIKLYQRPLLDLISVEKKLQFKAPLALKIADDLIIKSLNMPLKNGLDKELLSLEFIFQTKDALIGLESIGKSKPVFFGN
ncbi:MAG: 3-hydroxyacyl-CoA dehydrogenase/enoyl-CoA hydratase family protein [bacterium]|nr:3-hydroxyacyl-CoA dehydrogenase/enoyl-CoA hydratase family protein [bacterium]